MQQITSATNHAAPGSPWKGTTRRLPGLFKRPLGRPLGRATTVALLLSAVLSLPAVFSLPAMAAQLDGVSFPDEMTVGGHRLVLNGMAMRTYSPLRIHIYVAALYLEHKSDNPQTILSSPENKALLFRFSREVGADRARDSWRESFDDNCPAPCRFSPEPIPGFLASVPTVREGDVSTMTFTPAAINISMNGKLLGEIPNPAFAQMVLATFIGDRPSAPGVKRELLGLPN
jgi:hypothetical protein